MRIIFCTCTLRIFTRQAIGSSPSDHHHLLLELTEQISTECEFFKKISVWTTLEYNDKHLYLFIVSCIQSKYFIGIIYLMCNITGDAIERDYINSTAAASIINVNKVFQIFQHKPLNFHFLVSVILSSTTKRLLSLQWRDRR